MEILSSNECVICMNPEPLFFFSPCGHRCICKLCIEDYKKKISPKQCPICRSNYAEIKLDIKHVEKRNDESVFELACQTSSLQHELELYKQQLGLMEKKSKILEKKKEILKLKMQVDRSNRVTDLDQTIERIKSSMQSIQQMINIESVRIEGVFSEISKVEEKMENEYDTLIHKLLESFSASPSLSNTSTSRLSGLGIVGDNNDSNKSSIIQ